MNMVMLHGTECRPLLGRNITSRAPGIACCIGFWRSSLRSLRGTCHVIVYVAAAAELCFCSSGCHVQTALRSNLVFFICACCLRIVRLCLHGKVQLSATAPMLLSLVASLHLVGGSLH